MHTKSVLSLLVMAAAVLTFAAHDVEAGFPAPPGIFIPPGLPSVNVNVPGYIPAPPGVRIQVDAGRPYYVERDRRVYMEKKPKHYKKHHKKHHKHKKHRDH